MKTFNIFPLNHYPILQVSYALLIISTIPFALSEIRNSHIIDDFRGKINFHKFGFSQHGQASISIKDVSWKSKDHKAQFNASSMGFVLLNDSSFDPVENKKRERKQREEGEKAERRGREGRD